MTARRFPILFALAVLGLLALFQPAACGKWGGTQAHATDPKAPSPREQARADFSRSVRAWGSVLAVALIVAGLAALLASFTPAGKALGIDTTEALLILALSAGTPLVQYLLQAWGIIAADVGAVLMLTAGVASLIVWGIGLIRRRIRQTRAGGGT